MEEPGAPWCLSPLNTQLFDLRVMGSGPVLGSVLGMEPT